VLRDASRFVRPGGVLAYATCSLLKPENEERIAAFRADHPEFQAIPAGDAWAESLPGVPPVPGLGGDSVLLSPRRTETDGFFLALLRRVA
jgi:16S rRNA (cytosine967-C5)-methyltransferase